MQTHLVGHASWCNVVCCCTTHGKGHATLLWAEKMLLRSVCIADIAHIDCDDTAWMKSGSGPEGLTLEGQARRKPVFCRVHNMLWPLVSWAFVSAAGPVWLSKAELAFSLARPLLGGQMLQLLTAPGQLRKCRDGPVVRAIASALLGRAPA